VPYAFYLINKQFEKENPGITVNMVLQPFGNYRPLFAAAAAAHSGPDVWESLPGEFLYQYDTALLPLNKYVSSSFKSSLLGWSGSTVPEWHNSGTIYGIPSELQSYVWYYNKALFKKAGIAGVPQTWDAMTADAKKLKAAGITAFAMGLKDGFGADDYQEPMLTVMLPGNQILGLASGSPSWTSPRLEQFLNLLDGMGPYFEPGFQGIDFEGPGIDLFPGGKAAMISGLISNNNNYYQFAQSLGSNLGMFREPVISSPSLAKQLSFTSDYMWTVTKWTKDPAAAVAYSEFMETPYAQKILLNDGGDIPNLASTSQSSFVKGSLPAQIWSLIKSSTLVSMPGTDFSTEFETAFHEQIQDMFAGTQSVAATAQNLEQTAKSQG